MKCALPAKALHDFRKGGFDISGIELTTAYVPSGWWRILLALDAGGDVMETDETNIQEVRAPRRTSWYSSRISVLEKLF